MDRLSKRLLAARISSDVIWAALVIAVKRAQRRGPEDLVVAAAGNVSVTDTDNNRVLKLAIGAASLATPPFADLDHPPDSSHGPLQTACVGGDVRGGAGPARRGWQ